jgi:hypothetical protein
MTNRLAGQDRTRIASRYAVYQLMVRMRQLLTATSYFLTQYMLDHDQSNE